MSSSSKTKSSRSSLGKRSVRERESTGRKTKTGRVTGRILIHRKKHAAICNAEKLRQTEELAKLEARSQIFDDIENDIYLADRYVKRNNPTHMEGRTQTSIIPKIEIDGLMDRARNILEIRSMNINSNKEGCQKEADVKDNTKAAKYSDGELPKSKNQKEDCVQEPSYMGYSHVQQLLRKWYGDPHNILSSYRKKS